MDRDFDLLNSKYQMFIQKGLNIYMLEGDIGFSK